MTHMRECSKVLYIILIVVLYSLRHSALITEHSELISSIRSTLNKVASPLQPLAVLPSSADGLSRMCTRMITLVNGTRWVKEFSRTPHQNSRETPNINTLLYM